MDLVTKIYRRGVWLALFAACSLAAVGQDTSTPGQTGGGSTAPAQSGGGAAPAATGPAEQSADNPPLTGLDKPVSEPVFGGRSFIVPGAQLSQSVDAYTGGGNTYSVTRAVGSIDMAKTWKASQFALDYIGGGTFYEGGSISSVNAYQQHTMAANERIFWRTGQLAIRDSFDYLPEGMFGLGSYGGAGAFDASGGISGIGPGSGVGSGIAGNTPAGTLGAIGYGTYGIQPRIDNLSDIDVSQALSRRSSVTALAAYDFGRYLDKSSSSFPLFDSQQESAQVGYNYLLNAHDQIGFSYAHSQFHFPQQNGLGSVRSNVWNVLYGHRISGRLNLVIGGGPELVTIHSPQVNVPIPGIPGLFLTYPARTVTTISGSGSVTLDYTVSARTNFGLNYQRYISAGSGYFAGAKTDAVAMSVSHLFARRWTTSTSFGYSHNSNLQGGSPVQSGIASNYDYWYAGTSIRRQIGRHFDAFVSYQFDSFGFGSCPSTGASCGQKSKQHDGVIGIEWHPDPIRLD